MVHFIYRRISQTMWESMILTITSKVHGKVNIVYDECDHRVVSQFTWGVTKIGRNLYALTSILVNGRYTKRYLHRMIMSPQPELVVDHISRDTLDNRRQNLRVCRRSINNLNKDRIGSTGFANVTKVKNKFRSMIRFEGVSYHGGYFHKPEDAARMSAKMKENIFNGRSVFA